MKVTSDMVDRFLSWPLPESVCSDPCATTRGYPNRIGTNLLTADEARLMLEHVLADRSTDKPSQSPYSLGYNDLAERVVQLEGQLAEARSSLSHVAAVGGFDQEALDRASWELQRHFGREGSIYGIKACEEIARIALVAYGIPSATATHSLLAAAKLMLALIDGREAMPHPTDEVAQELRAAIEGASRPSTELEEGFRYWTHEGYVCRFNEQTEVTELLGPGGWTPAL